MVDRDVGAETRPVQVTGTPAEVKMVERTSTMLVYRAFTGTWRAVRGMEVILYLGVRKKIYRGPVGQAGQAGQNPGIFWRARWPPAQGAAMAVGPGEKIRRQV